MQVFGTCWDVTQKKNSSTSKIMQMYIALYALVTWQLKLKTLSVKNLFSNSLWFSYSSTFHLFSIYKTMVHNKSDLAQSIILWSSPGQIFIQGNMIKKWWKQGKFFYLYFEIQMTILNNGPIRIHDRFKCSGATMEVKLEKKMNVQKVWRSFK